MIQDTKRTGDKMSIPYENRSCRYMFPTGGDYYCHPDEMAIAKIYGGPLAPDLRGMVYFQNLPGGTWVTVNIAGLPPYRPAHGNVPPIGPHGFHLHQNGDCRIGDPANPFQAAGEHWNPDQQPHGNHAGDFPALFSNNGIASMSFFTSKFKVADIIGRSVVIHQNPDDYRSQPAGNSGKRLACGIIEDACKLP